MRTAIHLLLTYLLTGNCVLFSKTTCLQQVVASSSKPGRDVGSAARVRDASECLLDVLPGRVLIQSERRVGRIAEVDGTDARRVRPYVEIGHYGDEQFSNRFHSVPLNASRHVDHEYHVDVTATGCTKHMLHAQCTTGCPFSRGSSTKQHILHAQCDKWRKYVHSVANRQHRSVFLSC